MSKKQITLHFQMTNYHSSYQHTSEHNRMKLKMDCLILKLSTSTCRESVYYIFKELVRHLTNTAQQRATKDEKLWIRLKLGSLNISVVISFSFFRVFLGGYQWRLVLFCIVNAPLKVDLLDTLSFGTPTTFTTLASYFRFQDVSLARRFFQTCFGLTTPRIRRGRFAGSFSIRTLPFILRRFRFWFTFIDACTAKLNVLLRKLALPNRARIPRRDRYTFSELPRFWKMSSSK